MTQPPANNNEWQDFRRNGVPMIYFVLRAWASSVEVFLHRGFGDRYLGFPAASIVLLIPLYAIAWPHHDLRPLMLYLLGYLGMCGMARIGILLRRARGETIHSNYTGTPRLMRWFPRWNELSIKRFLEPTLVSCVGYLVGTLNPPLGLYLIIAGTCLFISVHMAEVWERTQAQDLFDAVAEQETAAERFRSMRGDRW